MLTIQERKFLRRKCQEYWSVASKTDGYEELEFNMTDEEVRKYGFFVLSMKMLLEDDPEYDDILESICNPGFVKLTNNDILNIHGIDAIYVDDTNKKILFFHFSFDPKFAQSEKEVFNNDFFCPLKKGEASIKEWFKKYNWSVTTQRDDLLEYEMELYFVNNGDNSNISNIDELRRELAGNVTIIEKNASDLLDGFIDDGVAVSSKLRLPSDKLLSIHESRNIGVPIAYIFTISLLELIRMTCNQPSLRYDVFANRSELQDVDIEKNVLSDNVRGFIANKAFIEGISRTIQEEPEHFCLFNNGMTWAAQNIESSTEKLPSGNHLTITIDDFKILNGGQTLRSIYEYKAKNASEAIDKLMDAQITIKVVKTNDATLFDHISEYSNTQNKIKSDDLKTNKEEQFRMSDFLRENGIYYERKKTDTKNVDSNYQYSITMQKVAMIIWAMEGYPEQVSNRKKDLFEANYEAIFQKSSLLESQALIDAIKVFPCISKIYKLKYKEQYFPLKQFYVLFIAYKCGYGFNNMEKVIDVFENFLLKVKFKDNKPSRMLIHPIFVILLKGHFHIDITDEERNLFIAKYDKESWELSDNIIADIQK